MNFDRLTEYLDTIPGFGAPGCDCLVMKEGKTVYRHMTGFADRENKIPMKGNELFFLYSTSKVITCTAAMQLYESGKFILTDPLEYYLPEFADMTVNYRTPHGEIRQRKAANPITVGDLFSMTSGIDYEIDVPEIQNVIKENPNATTREIIKGIAKKPLNFDPGTHWRYGLSHDVIGALIEVVSGKSFGEYVKENIFEPLDMSSTGFSQSEDVKSRMMAQYKYDYGTRKCERMELKVAHVFTSAYESGGAGIISSVEDYSKFASALANGGRGANGEYILSPTTIDLMRTNRLSEQALKDVDWSQLSGYGYGLGVRTMMNKAAAGSTGPIGEFGWGGAAGTYVLIDPENRINMFYAQHMLNNLEEIFQPRLRNILYTCL